RFPALVMNVFSVQAVAPGARLSFGPAAAGLLVEVLVANETDKPVALLAGDFTLKIGSNSFPAIDPTSPLSHPYRRASVFCTPPFCAEPSLAAIERLQHPLPSRLGPHRGSGPDDRNRLLTLLFPIGAGSDSFTPLSIIQRLQSEPVSLRWRAAGE